MHSYIHSPSFESHLQFPLQTQYFPVDEEDPLGFE